MKRMCVSACAAEGGAGVAWGQLGLGPGRGRYPALLASVSHLPLPSRLEVEAGRGLGVFLTLPTRVSLLHFRDEAGREM